MRNAYVSRQKNKGGGGLSSQEMALRTRRRFPNGLFLHALCDMRLDRVELTADYTPSVRSHGVVQT